MHSLSTQFQPRFVPCTKPTQTVSIYSTKRPKCTLCDNDDHNGHKMVYRLCHCRCVVQNCPVKYCSMECTENASLSSWRVSAGAHLGSFEAPPVRIRPSPQVKEYVNAHWKDKSPVRMHAHLQGACSLKTIQNMVYRLRRRMWTDDVGRCTAIVRANVFDHSLDASTPFFFGPQTLADRLLGVGSKQDPLMLGIATRTTLELLWNVESSGVLCIDATYCLNNRAFPVIIYGVADSEHAFRMAAIFVVSTETAAMYRSSMAALTAITNVALGFECRPQVVLSDGAKSIHLAVSAQWPQSEHLMCYAHMTRAVRRRLSKSVPANVYQDILTTIWEMHNASSLADYEALCSRALERWPEEVCDYMRDQWLEGPCSRWQLFRGRPDCPHSNQGQESFNRLLKDHFTLRRRCKMSECMDAFCRASRYIAKKASRYIAKKIQEENGEILESPGDFVFRTASNAGRTPQASTQSRF